MVAGGIVLSLGATGVLGIIIFGMNAAIATNATNIGTLRLDMSAIQGRMNTAEGNINVIEDELSDKTHELTALKNKTQHQSGAIGSTTFSGDMNIGTPLISTTTLYGTTSVFGDLLLNGIDINGVNIATINVRSTITTNQTNITTNQTNITNLQEKTSNMTTVNGVSTHFSNNLLLGDLMGDTTNVGTTLTALQNVTSNMTTVPTVSTNFTGDVYLGGTLNLRTTIESNIDDILTLQQDLQTANTTINHQASHITSLENQIEILNNQFDTMNFSNGFMDQISNNPFDNPFIDLFDHE